MKPLFILIASFVSFTLPGQDKNAAQKILIGFNFSPDYSYRKLSNRDGSASSDLVIKSRNELEVAKFGYTTGISILFNYAEQAGFETGIEYSNKGYQTRYLDLIYASPGSGLPTKIKFTYAYNYIGIPLKAKYMFGKNKWHFITSTGFMTSFLLNVKQTSNYQYSDGRTETKSGSAGSGFNKIDLSTIVSIGIDYAVNSKIHLTAEPTVRFGILKTLDAPVTEKLWNGGLNMVLYYNLSNSKKVAKK